MLLSHISVSLSLSLSLYLSSSLPLSLKVMKKMFSSKDLKKINVKKIAFLNLLMGDNHHFFKRRNQAVSEYITFSKSAYCFRNFCFRYMCIEVGVRAPDPDNNVFLLCCASKSLKSISLSEVWYHFVDEDTNTLEVKGTAYNHSKI